MSEAKEQRPPMILYVIMRTDLESMNPGKAMAQANHAFGALKSAIRKNPTRQRDYIAWQGTTEQDFGTVIVLGGTEGGIQAALDGIRRINLPVMAGWVHDPSYPVKDGEITHLIPLNTCAFVFGSKEECADACSWFELHP